MGKSKLAYENKIAVWKKRYILSSINYTICRGILQE
jgi:hypothetical protein